MDFKVNTRVKEVGSDAIGFVKENMILFFGDMAPEDLRQYCFILNSHELYEEIQSGDLLLIDGYVYTIEEVGSVANENFKNLPDEIKNQLKVMCVLFCADIGGILQLVFDDEGNLEFRTACNEDDLLYDDIGSGLKIKELRQKNEDLLRGLELYYKVIFDKLEE